MDHFDCTTGAKGRQLIFPLAGWIMLAVIMLFAAAAGGQAQPQLRSNGSAFDPSTSAVALKSNKRVLAAKPILLVNDLADVPAASSPIPAAYAVYPHLPVWRAVLRNSAFFAPDLVRDHSRLLALPLGARAPPAH